MDEKKICLRSKGAFDKFHHYFIYLSILFYFSSEIFIWRVHLGLEFKSISSIFERSKLNEVLQTFHWGKIQSHIL